MFGKKYTRLDADADSPAAISTTADRDVPWRRHQDKLLLGSICINCILTVAFIGAVGLVFRSAAQPGWSQLCPVDYEVSAMMEGASSLPEKSIKSYHFAEKGLDDDDFAKGDIHWQNLFPKGDGVVYLSDEETSMLRLTPADRDPWRGNDSMYMMAGWHSLHCLSSLRRILGRTWYAQETSTTYLIDEEEWGHAKHCLSDARQQLLCHFDETLFPAKDHKVHPGSNQPLVCKSLERIVEWTEGHWREATIPPGWFTTHEDHKKPKAKPWKEDGT